MANWKRGFFRLWVLLSVLWAIALGLYAANRFADPWVSETLFTFNHADELEVVEPYSDAYSKLVENEREGYYTRVGFKDDAPDMIYMAPNAFEVVIRGKKFSALLSNERVNNPDYDSLATALIDFIAKNDGLDLDPPITVEEARAAIPSSLKLQYREPWVKYRTHDFAVEMQSKLVGEARVRAITDAAIGIAIPPLIILVLGAAIGWVLGGFRKRQPTLA